MRCCGACAFTRFIDPLRLRSFPHPAHPLATHQTTHRLTAFLARATLPRRRLLSRIACAHIPRIFTLLVSHHGHPSYLAHSLAQVRQGLPPVPHLHGPPGSHPQVRHSTHTTRNVTWEPSIVPVCDHPQCTRPMPPNLPFPISTSRAL